MMRRMLLAIFLALSSLAPLQSPPAATPTLPDPSADARTALVGELDELYAKLRRRDWNSVHIGLAALLTRHANSAAARGKLLEIEDLARVAAFWVKHPEPDPKLLISGQVGVLDRANDKVRLTYEEGRLEKRNAKRPKFRPISVPSFGTDDAAGDAKAHFPDFEQIGPLTLHPLQFNGPYRAELRGVVPAREGLVPTIVLLLDQEEIYVATFDYPPKLQRIRDAQGGLEFVAESRIPVLPEHGGDFTIDATIAESSMSIRYNGRVAFQVPKPKGKFGWVGFLGGDQVHYVELAGKTFGQWIDALVDAAVDEDRAAFERTFEPRTVLPAWLYEVPDAAVRDEAGEQAAVGSVRSGFGAGQLAELEGLVEAGKWEAALTALDAHEKAGAKPPSVAWGRANVLFQLGRLEEARTAAKVVIAAESKHLDMRVLEAALGVRLEGPEATLERVRALVRDFPASPEARTVLVNALLRGARIADALLESERAFAAGVDRKQTAKLVVQTRRALSGPSWRTTNRHDSKHYAIASDMDRATCQQLATVLEDSYAFFARTIGPISDARSHMRVYVFSGKQAYFDYCKDLLGDAMHSTQGLFSAELAQLLFWNAVDREEFVQVARHEGFHQYLSELVDEVPVWLNEGLARYFETLRKEKGRWIAGAVPDSSRSTLRELEDATPWLPLAELFRMDDAVFYGQNAEVWYAYAWCVIHTLAEGTTADRKLFDALIAKLGRGVDGEVAVRETFEGVDLAELLDRVRAHAASL